MSSADSIFSSDPYLRRISKLTPLELSEIDSYLQLMLKQDNKLLNKTHYFNDRFENIYLKSTNYDLLNKLIDESMIYCADLLNVDISELKIGYWFNLMNPGQVTTLHRHDDWDELISGVIYLQVPENSGDLVLYHDDQEIVLPPRLGNYIYFDPKTPHKVTKNQTSKHRLSIGMNIGLITNDEE